MNPPALPPSQAAARRRRAGWLAWWREARAWLLCQVRLERRGGRLRLRLEPRRRSATPPSAPPPTLAQAQRTLATLLRERAASWPRERPPGSLSRVEQALRQGGEVLLAELPRAVIERALLQLDTLFGELPLDELELLRQQLQALDQGRRPAADSRSGLEISEVRPSMFDAALRDWHDAAPPPR